MIDSHCHLDDDGFAPDRAEVLARATAAGVTAIVVPAVRPRAWPALTGLRGPGGGPRLAFALGIHPQVVPDLDEAERATARDLAAALAAHRTARVVAIGECGLDGGTADLAAQERIFRAHVRAARDLGLPLIVHVVRAHHLAPGILRDERAGEVGGVIHSFSGSPELVPVYTDLGFHISFAGAVTWPGARRPPAAAAAVPEHLLLAETDAPDQTPAPHRGRRCEPAMLPDVIAGLARARATEPAAVAALTAANARGLFGAGLA